MARAAVLIAEGVVEAREVPIFEPEAGGLLLRVVLGGVCGTDLHMIHRLANEFPLPIILGHEGVGQIEKLGDRMDRDSAGEPVKVGDLVYWSPMVACNQCYTCTILESSPCTEAAHFAEADQPSWCSHADYAWLPRGMSFFKVPEGASIDAIMALGCALPTAVGSIDVAGAIKFGETVVVQGAGPVGLAATLVAHVSGAREIIVIDNNDMRLERAKQLGATATLSLDALSPDERKAAVMDVCGRTGPNMVVEAAGSLPAFPEGIFLGGHNGRYCVAGLWGAAGEIPTTPRELVLKNFTVRGSMAPRPKYYYHALHLAARMADKLPLAELITHRFGIGQAADAYRAVQSGEAVKVVIDPSIP
ncbi:zinc-binding dehydrogenase [Sphingobium phenoxybenzoativorans]|uniref:Zinc-binding dehydrogenase n=1 Tax=Sphingobium phenoxybenzoativorans TaxID=1592790 RepID=A0A975KBD8_9SPHN|nr:zinc-binding dehydrogenase [Sphingobium phenoxybenzoativorans]QUT06847.1 zinc-binding dehydrogenase [Sphingobium phenoxybenzoativorans]